jgi:hypothetical protein
MKVRKIVAAAAAVALLAAATVAQAQPGPAFHTVNSLGIWYWSTNSADEAIAVCRLNTPVGYVCWYKGFW